MKEAAVSELPRNILLSLPGVITLLDTSPPSKQINRTRVPPTPPPLPLLTTHRGLTCGHMRALVLGGWVRGEREGKRDSIFARRPRTLDATGSKPWTRKRGVGRAGSPTGKWCGLPSLPPTWRRLSAADNAREEREISDASRRAAWRGVPSTEAPIYLPLRIQVYNTQTPNRYMGFALNIYAGAATKSHERRRYS